VVKESKFGKMDPHMKENFSKIKLMDKENSYIVTVITMKDIGLITWLMVSVNNLFYCFLLFFNFFI